MVRVISSLFGTAPHEVTNTAGPTPMVHCYNQTLLVAANHQTSPGSCQETVPQASVAGCRANGFLVARSVVADGSAVPEHEVPLHIDGC